jgi:hypothetical protein
VRPGGGGAGTQWPNRPGINRPGINRPGIDRPIVNRPNINRPNIGSGNIGIGQIGDRFTNISNDNTNIVNRPVINRPTVIAGGGGGYYGGGYGGGGYYGGGGGYYDGGYYPSAPAYDTGSYAGYAPAYGSVGYGGSPYGAYGYDSYHEDWYQGAWSGLANLAGSLITGGIGLAAAAPAQQTVVYANPYQASAPPAEATATTTVVVPQSLDYSQPITPPTAKEAPSEDDVVVKVGMRTFEEAREAMKKGNFPEAQERAEKAIQLVPKDPAMHEFRALCQFAQGKYKDAAATLYAVLSIGPGFDWNTVAALYPDPDTYGKQLHALEDAVRADPKDSALHFLLGYHYMVLDERQAALEEFKEASRLSGKDEVSKRIVAALERGAAKDPTKPGE